MGVLERDVDQMIANCTDKVLIEPLLHSQILNLGKVYLETALLLPNLFKILSERADRWAKQLKNIPGFSFFVEYAERLCQVLLKAYKERSAEAISFWKEKVNFKDLQNMIHTWSWYYDKAQK